MILETSLAKKLLLTTKIQFYKVKNIYFRRPGPQNPIANMVSMVFCEPGLRFFFDFERLYLCCQEEFFSK